MLRPKTRIILICFGNTLILIFPGAYLDFRRLEVSRENSGQAVDSNLNMTIRKD